jgi:hypothetical protein
MKPNPLVVLKNLTIPLVAILQSPMPKSERCRHHAEKNVPFALNLDLGFTRLERPTEAANVRYTIVKRPPVARHG